MMKSPFQLKSSKEIYKNKWIDVREDKVIRPGGKEGLFGIVTMSAGSTILALTDNHEIFLVKEYKYAIRSYSLELISGAIDKPETPLNAAQRELEEEIGFKAKRWIDAGVLNPFTTVIDSPNHMFIAYDLEKTKQKLDEGEQVDIIKVSLDKAIEMVIAGEITHGASSVLILKSKIILKREGII